MKRTALIFSTAFLMILTFSTAFSQELGIRVGANFANVSGIEDINTSSKFNMTVGVFAVIHFGNFGLNPEVIYEGRGFKYEESGVTLKQKLSYITVPVYLNYYLLNEKLYIQAGPYFGFLMNADLGVSGSLGILAGDNKDQFKSVDYGLGVGAGVNLGRFDVGLRYNLGLGNIAEESGDSSIKNRVLNVHMGFKIIK